MDSDDSQSSEESVDGDTKHLKSQTDTNTNVAAVIILSDDEDDDAQDLLKITSDDIVGCKRLISQSSAPTVADCTHIQLPATSTSTDPFHVDLPKIKDHSKTYIGDTEIKTLNKICTTPSTSTSIDPFDAALQKIKDHSKTFNTFELQLIKYAEKNPILYDTTFKEVLGSRHKRVKELWDLFSKTNYPKAPHKMSNDSLKSWNRIRLEYFIVRKLKDDHKEIKLRPPLSKYLDECLNFLEPTYTYIKKCSFQIYYDGSSPLVDLGCLEAINNPSLYEKILIAFVKHNRFMYDVRMRFVKTDDGRTLTRKSACKRYWEELAINLNSSRQHCETEWSNMEVTYLKHLIRKNKSSLRKLKQLSFLDELYDFPDLEGDEISESKTDNVKINEDIFLDLMAEEDGSSSSSSLSACSRILLSRKLNVTKQVDQKNNNKKCIIIDDNEADVDRKEKNTETTSSETESSSRKRKRLSDEMLIEVFNDMRQVSKIKKTLVTKGTQSDPSLFLKNIHLDSENFFGEIGQFVSDYFYEEQQRDIRIKSWALVTQLELEMLEEE
ncbi:hypothetical protein O0L34_g4577 [Tuta absoluta]|nr:hypothetical protein O0L34_g4577 [Tuta absoluta]